MADEFVSGSYSTQTTWANGTISMAPLVPNWTAIACEEKKMRALAEEKNAMLEAQIEMLRNLVCELSNRPTIDAYKQLEADLALTRTIMHDEGAIQQRHNFPTSALKHSR